MDYRNHGRRHGPFGTDRITGFIGYLIENFGGWLHIATNDVDGDGLAIKIVSSGGDTWWYPSGEGLDQNGEWIIWGDSGSELGLFSGGSVILQAGSSQSVDIKAGGSTVLRIDADGSIHGPTGGSITWDL